MSVSSISELDMNYGGRASRANVGRLERLVSMMAGGALAVYGLKHRQKKGGAAAVAAAGLLYRGATGHCPVYGAIGLNTAGPDHTADIDSDTRQNLGGASGVRVEDSISIARPVEEVYRFWRDLENLPRFMTHLESVSVREEGISHWVAKGPAGTTVEWDARIINDIENELIAWQSLTGSTVSTAGSVRFFHDRRGGTVVRVKFQYYPPAGNLGAAVASALGEDPRTQVRDALRQLKRVLETRDMTAGITRH